MVDEVFGGTPKTTRRRRVLHSITPFHHGGEAARKGWRHVAWFIGSGFRFYAKHGWRWL